jgi:hypothetical protein
VTGQEEQMVTGGPRPIFLLGCPRSGTTLLRVMLNAHPEIALPPENRFVAPLWFGRHRFAPAGSARAARRMARALTKRGRGSSHLGVSREALVAEFERTRPESVAAALDQVFATYAHSHGKARWGDKRPAYYTLVDELHAMFPEAKFVHLARDGRGCVASLKRPPFSYSSTRAVATWLNSMHAGRRALRRLGPERVLELRYEDLTTATEETLRRLCDFISEDFAEAMLHPEAVVETYVPAHFEQHGQIAAGVNTSSMRAWERELSPVEVAAVERLGARDFRRFGWDRTTSGRPSGLMARAALSHLRFRVVLPVAVRLDRATDLPGPAGKVARRLWRRLPLRRQLFR